MPARLAKERNVSEIRPIRNVVVVQPLPEDDQSPGGIVIPEGVSEVVVRAHDLVDGFGGLEVTVDLTVESGQGFEVERP